MGGRNIFQEQSGRLFTRAPSRLRRAIQYAHLQLHRRKRGQETPPSLSQRAQGQSHVSEICPVRRTVYLFPPQDVPGNPVIRGDPLKGLTRPIVDHPLKLDPPVHWLVSP